MTNNYSKNSTLSLVALSLVAALSISSVGADSFGATTTLTGKAGQTVAWNSADGWSAGVPDGETDVVIGEGVVVSVRDGSTPAYSGSLTLSKNATLQLPKTGTPKVVSGASVITLQEGSRIQLNMNSNITFPPIKLEGDAAIECQFGASDKQTDNFGPITGAHTLRLAGFNRHKYIFDHANTFSRLIMDAKLVGYCEVFARAPGALGTGDVILDTRAVRDVSILHLDVADTMADNATLHLSGSSKVIIKAGVTETIAGLTLNGKTVPAGTYSKAEPWLEGEGTLKVAPIQPLSPTPAFEKIVSSGDVKLTWKNLVPKSGTDVTVDVWFSTDPKALTQVVDGKANLTAATVKAPVADTYYWRVDSYLDGPAGKPTTGTLLGFIVNDTDGDGFLDDYELAHTNPKSRTALNPGDDIDGDGLTNLQEFRLATNPMKPDTDGDGLKDGPETQGAGKRAATSPTNPDTDGDGLSDGVESNSGTFVGKADTGTDPLKQDTDGDLVDDQTEVVAFLARPGSADPLKAEVRKVKVFILMGQSNMVGAGGIGPAAKDGTLAHAVSQGKYPYLVNPDGTWRTFWSVRDVFVMSAGVNAARVQHNQPMSIGGLGRIGPEIGIAQQVRSVAPAPFLILKSCIGNRSLGFDLLPPGSEPYEVDGKVVPGYRGTTANPNGNGQAPTQVWYPGIQYDGDIQRAKAVLADLDKYYPGARDNEIAGFFFWQGDKDRYGNHLAKRYEQNLVRLIKQLRKDFNAPNAPFVCATLGQTAKDSGPGNDKLILDAQLAVDGNSGEYPEFKGNVATVYTHPLSKGGASNGHYGGNAETYMNVGEAMGKAMVELQKAGRR